MEKIAIGSDKQGYEIKNKLIDALKSDYELIDVGTFTPIPCDYPIFAKKVADLVSCKECKYGILLCGSGEGMCIASNKIGGIRCGIGYNDDVSRLMREHNDANVISFGTNFMSFDEIKQRVLIFLKTDFIGKHHVERINQIIRLEKKEEI